MAPKLAVMLFPVKTQAPKVAVTIFLVKTHNTTLLTYGYVWVRACVSVCVKFSYCVPSMTSLYVVCVSVSAYDVLYIGSCV